MLIVLHESFFESYQKGSTVKMENVPNIVRRNQIFKKNYMEKFWNMVINIYTKLHLNIMGVKHEKWVTYKNFK